MKILGLIMFVFASSVFADADMADEFFSKKNVNLPTEAKKALQHASTWGSGSSASKAFRQSKGGASFLYDGGQITVVCAVQQVCDIVLQPGELTTGNPELGDPQFIVSEPVSSGEGENKQIHINIKPLDVGIDTTFNVYTNRRAYYFRLISTRHQSMQRVSFIYQDGKEKAWAMSEEKAKNKKQQTGYIDTAKNINFNYTIDGDVSWKPERVYNDGVRTIIEMPKSVSNKSIPAFLVLKYEGGFFSEDKNALVNYSFVPADDKTGQAPKYIVDNLFNKGVLISGVGDTQEKVVITMGGS